jgi:PKHD-type hydroxylase
MFHIIDAILNKNELAAVLAAAEQLEFEDGGKTAGAVAKMVKQNQQANSFSKTEAHGLVLQKLRRHPDFEMAAMPERISELLLSRYESGMAYGLHLDNPVIGLARVRTDLAFTLFLSDPNSYEGGALGISIGSGRDNIVSYKLPLGSAVLYPAHYLHQVVEVTAGSRLAIVGWVQSAVRDAAQREIIRDLRLACNQLHRFDDNSVAFDGANRALNGLLRMWIGK